MKGKLSLVMTFLLGVALLTGCSSDTEKETKKKDENKTEVSAPEIALSPKEEATKEAKEVLNKYLAASQEEDVEKYLETFHIPEESQDNVRTQVQQIFDTYDLTIAFEGEIKVNRVSEDNKQVVLDVVQTTEFPEGTKGNLSNKVWATHTVEFKNNKWGITTTEITKSEPLE